MTISPAPLVTPTVATIPSGAAIMAAGANLKTGRLFGIIMPAGWDAASLTFQASYDGTNYFNLYDSSGNEITFTVAANRFVRMDDAFNWMGIGYVKLRSGTNGTPVNQTADRVIGLVIIN